MNFKALLLNVLQKFLIWIFLHNLHKILKSVL